MHSCYFVFSNVCRSPDLPSRYYIVTSLPSGSIASVISSSQLSSCMQPADDDGTATLHSGMTIAIKEQTDTTKTNEV